MLEFFVSRRAWLWVAFGEHEGVSLALLIAFKNRTEDVLH